MNSKAKFVFLIIVSLSIIIGAIVLSINLFSLGDITMAGLLMIVMFAFVGILSIFLRKSYDNLKSGIPSDDERTKKVRMYAAGYAYFISLYVWILLLAFHRYLDSDDVLMIGLVAMALSFYLSWFVINRKKDLE